MPVYLLKPQLPLTRCPHCSTDQPSLTHLGSYETTDNYGQRCRFWSVYKCARCGGLVTASAEKDGHVVKECYPGTEQVNAAIPSPAIDYFRQAMESIHAPAGAVLLAANAVDSMLRAKGFQDGPLLSRVDQAAEEHLITKDLAKWAHQVRLDTNDQTDNDESVPLPSEDDARKSLHFVEAFANFLFVVPAMVTRGLKESEEDGDLLENE